MYLWFWLNQPESDCFAIFQFIWNQTEFFLITNQSENGCVYHLAIDLERNGILFGSKSIEKGLCLPSSNLFRIKRNSIWFKINLKLVPNVQEIHRHKIAIHNHNLSSLFARVHILWEKYFSFISNWKDYNRSRIFF